AVQRLISSSITALIRVSLERLHLSRKSLGHYIVLIACLRPIAAPYPLGRPGHLVQQALGLGGQGLKGTG
ncbi:hypothetical protein QFW77_15060, partial [Luteimonas sp. RD2P54]